MDLKTPSLSAPRSNELRRTFEPSRTFALVGSREKSVDSLVLTSETLNGPVVYYYVTLKSQHVEIEALPRYLNLAPLLYPFVCARVRVNAGGELWSFECSKPTLYVQISILQVCQHACRPIILRCWWMGMDQGMMLNSMLKVLLLRQHGRLTHRHMLPLTPP